MIEGGPFGVIGSFEFGLRGFLHGPRHEVVETPHGAVEAALGDVDGDRVALLTRPGRRHPLSPNARSTIGRTSPPSPSWG